MNTWKLMSLEISDPLRKYVRLTEDGRQIERFICPVEDCTYATRLGPGALRMHLLIKADPTKASRYCSKHEEHCRSHDEDFGLDVVRYLSNLPRVKMKNV